MDSVARRYEATPGHSQDQRIESKNNSFLRVHDDLLTRIRTLLASRNGQNPPKTPLATPDYTLILQGVDGNASSSSHTSPSYFDFGTSNTVRSPDGVEKKRVSGKDFEQPVRTLEASSADSATDSSKGPDFDQTPRASLSSEDMAAIDEGFRSNTLGRGRRKSNDPRMTTNVHATVSAGPQSHHQGHGQRFVLRTVLPHDYRLTEERLRPSVHHVPGSYRSEINYGVDSDETDLDQPSAVVGLSADDGRQWPISVAVSADHQLDITEAKHATRDLTGSRTIPRRKSSLRSTGSAATVRLHRQSGLERSSAEPLVSKEHLPLPDTFSLDHADEQKEERSLFQPLSHTSNLVDKETSKPFVEKQPTPPVSALPVIADGSRLSELLAELPPIKQEVVDEFKGHHLTAVFEQNTKTVPLNPESLFGHESEWANRSSSPGVPVRHSPQIPKRQPGDSGKPSSHTRAASRSSSMSSDSTVHMLNPRHMISDVSEDFHNEATGLLRPPPPFFKGDRVTPDHIKPEASLADGSGYPQQSHRAAEYEDSEETRLVHGQSRHPDRNWIQHILRRPSDKPYPQEPPNLTARPFYRPRRTSTKPTGSSHTGFLPLREDELPTNIGGSLQASQGERTQSVVGGSADKQMTPDSFSKVILDLETLLNEALSVAKNAADQDDTEAVPAILEEASRMLKNEAHGIREDRSEGGSSTDSDDSPSRYGTGLESLGQPRDHVVIIEPHDEELHSGFFRRIRGSTPYPSSPAPASRQPSVAPWDERSMSIPLRTLSGAQSKSTNREQISTLPQDSNPENSGCFELLRGLHLPDSGATQSPRRMSIRSPTPPIAFEQTDWAYVQRQRQPRDQLALPQAHIPTQRMSVSFQGKEETGDVVRETRPLANVPSSDEVQNYIALHHQPPIQPRISSAGLRSQAFPEKEDASWTFVAKPQFKNQDGGDVSSVSAYQQSSHGGTYGRSGSANPDPTASHRSPLLQRQQTSLGQEMTPRQHGYHRPHRRHRSSSEHHGFSLGRSHRHAPIARDWGTPRKRWVATVACISTAMLGLIVGIYAGEVPAIQYTLGDEHHYTILGNVVLYVGLAIPTILFWPLPLLHGRKPYTLIALALLLPLQFPQALVLNAPRSPSMTRYRVGLLLSRALSGVCMGFANINFMSTLLDLFGASLQSGNPHQEVVNEDDVRRHGGGMGLWLGIWTWCFMGSVGVGFLIGALVISELSVEWGFYITIVLIAFILFLNVLTPEVRRSAHRRSIAEVRSDTNMTKRVAKGEVMMHITSTGSTWWWDEVFAGQVLCARMLKQPGFVVLSLYLGWIYGQIIMIIVLLGALISKYYRFRPPYVGLCVFAIPLGALLAIPFQKASLFSRSRRHPPRTDSMTFQKQGTWTSHLLRRIIFMILLPLADLAYTLASSGPPVHFIVPTIFAGLIGFLSNLAIAECNGYIMETYDTSDLQPGMIGRPRNSVPEIVMKKRTTYTCYPRVTAGFSISQAFAFLIGAAATGAGGAIERSLGARTATGVVAGVLLVLTLLLIWVVWRFKEVQVVPTDRFGTGLSLSGEEPWRPIIIGNPSGRTRRMSLLELGRQSRWSEIRRKNKLTGWDRAWGAH